MRRLTRSPLHLASLACFAGALLAVVASWLTHRSLSSAAIAAMQGMIERGEIDAKRVSPFAMPRAAATYWWAEASSTNLRKASAIVVVLASVSLTLAAGVYCWRAACRAERRCADLVGQISG